LVVKASDNETEILIPFVFDEVVLQVDLQNQQILVDWQADYL
jgi:ribosomal 30S subunit maturation factor RimM